MIKEDEGHRFPTYPYPWELVAKIAFSVLFLRHRSFRQDAIRAISGLSPAPHFYGLENVPKEGPCLLTLNHYYRPGYGAWWSVLAITSVVSLDIHWVMTGTLTYPGQRRGVILKPLSTWLLHRLGRIYGFTNMPAMPPDPREVEQRAASVRELATYAHQVEKPVIGLAPEGRDILSGTLGELPSGAGRLMAFLARQGLVFLPIGVYEDEGVQHVSFGKPYILEVKAGLSHQELDDAVAQVVMDAIAQQLPSRMHGKYG